MRLPPELIDRIIDYFHDDNDSLKAFCLISRILIPSSRFHLWKRLKLTPFSVFEGILTKQPFTSPGSPVFVYVKELDIEDGRGRYAPMWLDDNMEVLSLFKEVQTLRLRVVNFSVLHPENIRLFNSTFSRTTRLVLTQVHFASVVELDELVRCMPALQSVGFLSAIEWKHFTPPDAATPKFPPTLHSLEMDMFKKQSLLDRFLGSDNYLNITTLHMTRLWPDDVQYASSILPLFGGTLHTLSLGLLPLSSSIWRRTQLGQPVIIADKFNLSYNTGLRKLTLYELSVYNPLDLPLGHDWVCKLLLQLKSPVLEEIVIELLADTSSAINLLDLPRAFAYLSKSRFPKFRHVVLDVTGDAPETSIRDVFSQCENPEILLVRCAVPDPVFLTFT